MTYSIALTSDHQIYNNRPQRKYLTKVLSDIASLKTDAVFMLGDIVDKGDPIIPAPTPLQGFMWADYYRYLRSSGINLNAWYPLAGNHDASYKTISEYTLVTRKPPVYALTCGNVVFIFCGYEGSSYSQDVSQTAMDQVQHLLMKFERTHNIVLLTHAPLYEAGVFDYAPMNDAFRLKPQARWLSFFETYKISAHFFGHSACDIVSADETNVITHSTRTNAAGFTTHYFLTGPHIEQKQYYPDMELGGRVLFLDEGRTTATVKTRDHLNKQWVTEKEYEIPLRFPLHLDGNLTDIGGDSVHPFMPFMTATPKVILGRTEPNQAMGGLVDQRRHALTSEWIDYTEGDLENQELLVFLSTPGDSTISRGGSVQFGARRAALTDTDLSTEFVIYGTDSSGIEQPVMLPVADGRYAFQGNRYPTSMKYPMVQAAFDGVISASVIPYGSDVFTVAGWLEYYDDFGQFDPISGVFTCTQTGVYNFQGMVQFNGHSTAVVDIVQLYFTRIRSGLPQKFGVVEACLPPTDSTSRTVLNTPVVKIGLFAGETVTLNVEGWKYFNTNTINRAGFTADMVRSA